MAISNPSSSDREIINPATGLLNRHPRGPDRNLILCRIDSWFYGMPDRLFDEAVRNGEMECARGTSTG